MCIALCHTWLNVVTKSEMLLKTITLNFTFWDCSSMVEHLPSSLAVALGFIPSSYTEIQLTLLLPVSQQIILYTL